MDFLLVLPYYLVWHYGKAYSDIKSVWKNFLVFLYHFFSIPILFRTLFAPWQRIQDGYGPGSKIMETFIFNTIMRVVGVVIRLFFIILGLLLLFTSVLLGIGFFLVWLFLPFILIVLILWGIKELII